MTSHGQCPGGGGLVNVEEWGPFSILRRAGDGQCPGGGGGECSPPPPFRKSP